MLCCARERATSPRREIKLAWVYLCLYTVYHVKSQESHAYGMSYQSPHLIFSSYSSSSISHPLTPTPQTPPLQPPTTLPSSSALAPAPLIHHQHPHPHQHSTTLRLPPPNSPESPSLSPPKRYPRPFQSFPCPLSPGPILIPSHPRQHAESVGWREGGALLGYIYARGWLMGMDRFPRVMRE